MYDNKSHEFLQFFVLKKILQMIPGKYNRNYFIKMKKIIIEVLKAEVSPSI